MQICTQLRSWYFARYLRQTSSKRCCLFIENERTSFFSLRPFLLECTQNASNLNLCLEWISWQGMFLEYTALFWYSIRRLIVASREDSKPRDLYLELFDRSKIWQTHRQYYCQCVCQISKRCDDLNYQSRGFRDFMRSYDKTSYRILKRTKQSLWQSGLHWFVTEIVLSDNHRWRHLLMNN